MRALLLFSLALVGCSGATDDPGLDSLLRVSGAQFYRGKPPAATSGPSVTLLNTITNLVRPGEKSKNLSGDVPAATHAIAFYLAGDSGYWVTTPGAEDSGNLGQLTFGASLSFSPLLADGSYTLGTQAIDGRGQAGPASTTLLSTASSAADSTLSVGLAWDTEADLDLHVVTPAGTEIWAKHINSATPPGPGDPPNPTFWMSGGILDFDSNSNCVIDGRRRENALWTTPPPSGHYRVRVDAFSLCGEAVAHWNVNVSFGGQTLALSHGALVDADTAGPHDKGAGVLAAEFDIP